VGLRIGIAGSDNTHALGFAKFVNVQRALGDSARIVAITGDDAAQTASVAAEGEIEEVVATAEDLVGRVDTAIVVHRHASRHLANARPLALAGLPILIDKPFASDAGDAAAFLALAARHGSLVASYSTLRLSQTIEDLAQRALPIGDVVFGSFSGPCDFDSQWDGAFHYGIHTVEMAATLMPAEPMRVRTTRVGDGRCVVVELDSGARMILNLDPNLPDFTAELFGRETSVSCRATSRPPDIARLLQVFLDMIESGVPPLSARQLLDPVATMAAVIESERNDGAWIAVAKPPTPDVAADQRASA
jgi:predicted dehydrogenase